MFFLSPSVLRGPSADRRELCHVIPRKLGEFYNASPKYEGSHQKMALKHAKFRSNLYNLRLRSRVGLSPERLKISKIGKLIFSQHFLLRSTEIVR